MNQRVAVRMLERLGYRSDVAGNGKEAVAALASIPYALVLMDCQMPEVDGYQATAVVRAGSGPNQHVPIIAMTASAMREDTERALEAGMDAHLSKPVKLEVLAETVDRWLHVVAAPAGH